LQIENEKQEYLGLVEQKKKQEETMKQLEIQLQNVLQYSVSNKELYDNLKAGLNQDTTIKNKIDQTNLQIENIHKKEKIYRDELDSFVKEMELNVCVPKLVEAVKSEVNLILKIKNEQLQKQNSDISTVQIEAISTIILQYLKENNLILSEIAINDLVDYVIAKSNDAPENNQYDFLEFSEVKALEDLLNIRTSNAFPSIDQQQVELNVSLSQVPSMENQIENMKTQIAGRDYALLKAYEDNENNIKNHQNSISDANAEINKIEKKLHQFDIQMSQEPDPKYEALGKLKGFFEDVANKLLKVKKQQIELAMKQDLNINLAAYKDVIDRVELSENLKDLTFKIYHKSGNEIYLSQLNAASKQVVIQVLLKALHELGDYDPPVMIDTVIGVLDETSRATVLENYFPELSQQTILFSSDSEIRTGKDLEKIEPFISKAFTLTRDRERQLTDVQDGYFGITIKN
jgi:DNA sulfur modification protein DndD